MSKAVASVAALFACASAFSAETTVIQDLSDGHTTTVETNDAGQSSVEHSDVGGGESLGSAWTHKEVVDKEKAKMKDPKEVKERK